MIGGGRGRREAKEGLIRDCTPRTRLYQKTATMHAVFYFLDAYNPVSTTITRNPSQNENALL
jgi:hypothetical protein